MRARLWEARAAKLRECADKGMTQAEAGREVGMSPPTVRRYAAMYGLAFAGRAERAMKATIEDYRACAERGLTMQQAATELGVSYATVFRHAHLNQITFKSGWVDNLDVPRAEAMAAMYRAGQTLQEIGEVFGVSRERVRQIIKQFFGMVGSDGGRMARSAARAARQKAIKDARCLAKHGCTQEQLEELRQKCRDDRENGFSYYRTPIGAFNSQRTNARNRGIEWKMTLWEWWTAWQRSGKWEERGRCKDNYVMCRLGDAGAYEIGNVYIATAGHNLKIQPNNPYRKSHPDFEKTMAAKRERGASLPGSVHKPVNSDLPRGVTRHRSGRYQAQIADGGRNVYLGSFGTPEEAAQAYAAAAAKRTANRLPSQALVAA